MFYSRSRQTWIAHKFPELLARQFSVRYHQMRPKNYIISVRLCDVILLLTFFVNIRRSILKLRVLKWLNGNCNWLVFAMANWIRVTGICSMGIGGGGGKSEMGMGQLSSSMSNQCLANTRSFKKVRKLLKVPIVHQFTTGTLECFTLPLPCGQRCLCKLRTAIQTTVKITCLCCS